MGILVVTGTGTGVGKTVVTAALASLGLARGASTAVVKPGQTGVGAGEPGDIAEVRRLAGSAVHLAELSRYEAPLAPAAAARGTGRPAYPLSDAADVIQHLATTHRLVVVEGAGGLLVRYDDEGSTIADLARWLHAPCVVVADPALGTLNHTALTLEALAHRGLELAGVVIGAWPQEPDLAMRSNIRDLETLAARPLSGAIPADSGRLTPDAFAEVAHASLAPDLGGRFDATQFRNQADAAPATPATSEGAP